MAAISLKPGSKGVVALIVVAAAIFVGCILAYLGVAGKMRSTAAELEAKRNKLEESKEIAQKLEKSKLDYQDTLSQIRFLETSVSTEAYIPTLLQQLEQVAESVDLKVTGVTPSKDDKKSAAKTTSSDAKAPDGSKDGENTAEPKKKAPPPYDELNITVAFKGKYMNVLDFLYKLNTFPKILAVKSVTISPGSTELSCVQAPLLEVSMTVTAYVLKKDDPASLPSMPAVPATTSATLGGRAKNEAG